LAPRLSPSKGSKPDKLMRDALMVALNREATNAGEPQKGGLLYPDGWGSM